MFSGCEDDHSTAMANQLTAWSKLYYQLKPAGGRIHPWISLTNTHEVIQHHAGHVLPKDTVALVDQS